MNITDIDDKIIKRARQEYLYEKYIEEQHSLDEILSEMKKVMEVFKQMLEKTTDADKKQMYEKTLHRLTLSVENLVEAVKIKDEEKINLYQEVLDLGCFPRESDAICEIIHIVNCTNLC